MMYVRFPLSLRNVEDLLFERGVGIRHETVQPFASVQANGHKHFNLERHLIDRQTYKTSRSTAVAAWQNLMA